MSKIGLPYIIIFLSICTLVVVIWKVLSFMDQINATDERVTDCIRREGLTKQRVDSLEDYLKVTDDYMPFTERGSF